MSYEQSESSDSHPKHIQPAYMWTPNGSDFRAGDEAADFAESLGFQVGPEERDVLRTLLAENGFGKWAGLESAIVCGRQNIKTWALEICGLYDVYVRDIKRVTWSAQLFSTTQQAFADFLRVIENNQSLSRRVKKINRGKGDEGIEFLNGASLDFLARSNKSGRGLTGDTVILDEALFVTPEQLGALMPTLSSRPNPHVLYGSSPGIIESEVLRRLRDRGRAGDDPSLTYIEYSSERKPCRQQMCSHQVGTPGCLLDDESRWFQANPALGRRISLDYVRNERRALPPVEFMRERLGWWQDPLAGGDKQAIPDDKWEARINAESQIEIGSRVAFAVDTSWDRQVTWIAVCGTNTQGNPHIEIIAQNFGTDWVSDWLRARVDEWKPVAIGLQGHGSPVASLVESLQQEFGDLVVAFSGSDLGKACGGIYDAVTGGSLVHLSQQPLNDSIKHAAIRPLGDSWVWDRKNSPVDIAPLVAVTEALSLWASGRGGASVYETKDLLVF